MGIGRQRQPINHREEPTMAASFQNDTTKRTTTLVADYPENIKIDPELNGRIDDTDITDLAADIEKNGQHSPVKIRKNAAGQPLLVFGHRRWRAVLAINERRRKAGEGLLRLECSYEALTDEEAFHEAITENRFRKDATPMDDCNNISIWKTRFKKSVDEIAAIYFPEAHTADAKATALKWVTDRASLVELVPEAQAAVREGGTKITAAVKLARLAPDHQKAVIAETKNTVKGKVRIKVSNVVAAKKTPAKATAPAKPAAPAPKVTSSVYEAAEKLARAVDAWLVDATGAAEKTLVAAHKEYRVLVPFRRAESKAA
jgi:ParB-like chromosome segregation protein Spo0J